MLLADKHFLDITARLAKKILDLGDTFGIREGGQVRIGVKITQKDLASMIGATRESINSSSSPCATRASSGSAAGRSRS